MLFAAPHPVGAAPWAAADGSRAAETARLARARRKRGARGRPSLGWGWRAAAAPSCITSSSMRCVSRRPRRLPHMRVRMVCRRRVYVPRAHDRVRSLRLPTSRGARPCCGRRLEGSRLERRRTKRATLAASPLPLTHTSLTVPSDRALSAAVGTSRRHLRPTSCGGAMPLVVYDHAGAAGADAAASALAEEASER